MSTDMERMWKVAGDSPYSNNVSNNMANWDTSEMRKFLQWFINTNYPEAIEQFQAIRAIERKAEEQAEIEREIIRNKMMQDYRSAQIRGMQNAYPYGQYPYATTQIPEPPKKSFWERCKELARRPLGHGDYY